MSNIDQRDKLVFYTEKGYEIPVEKTYSIQWEIIPHVKLKSYFLHNPKGHFMYDIDDTDHILTVEFDNKGLFNYVDNIKVNTGIINNETGNSVEFTINNITELILFNKEYTYKKSKGTIFNRNEKRWEEDFDILKGNIYNTVRLTFNTLVGSITQDYPVNYIFETCTVENNNNYKKLTNLVLTQLTQESEEDKKQNLGQKTFVNYLIVNNFNNYEDLFPCVRYIGSITQDKVSTEFVAASTFIILDENGDRPNFNIASDNYYLKFEFQKDSEMKFISSDSVANIIWEDSHEVKSNIISDAHNPFVKDTNTPIYFSVGFQTAVEGCYQNIMAMYIVSNNTGKKYILGLFTFLTEVVGEDERYRALLGNLGIPDPVKYPNIFKSQDPDEQGVDWTLINDKSKELMINYDNIFPYVGTYKALMGAIKFLGYGDLIFKEWYKIKDQNNKDRYVTLQTYDLQKGESLNTKLKKIGVTYGEFERYKKINRLSMIYHLNEIDDETGEYLDMYTRRLDNPAKDNPTTAPESGLYKASYKDTHHQILDSSNFTQKHTYFQLPITKTIYEYRTDEILAKLFSVKQWLEKYILGVNCFISDICGEGIIVERLKNQAYVTQHHLQDITTISKVTPKIIKYNQNIYVSIDSSNNEIHTDTILNTSHLDSSIDDECINDILFRNSTAILRCSLNEFDSLTIGDYDDFEIEDFIIDTSTPNDKVGTVYISAPLETLVTVNEYQFQLTNKNVSSGTLAEFTDTSYINNPILIQDNEILFYDDTKNFTKIDNKELPIIEITQGNLRYCHGDWKSNIAYSINVVSDQKSGKEYYALYETETDEPVYKDFQKVILYPMETERNYDKYKLYWAQRTDKKMSSKQYNGLNSEFIYTSQNKWNVPQIIIRNYKCGNNDEVLPGDYILEIIEGRILFRNKQSDLNINNGKAYGCELEFGEELESSEQPINVNYTYMSDRVPIYTIDSSSLKNAETQDDIEKCVHTNKYVDVSVNRLGNYTVSVNAYDYYNNIFVNQSDDITTVTTKPISLDIILNESELVNNKDFYHYNAKGIYMNTLDTSNLFGNINKNGDYPIYPQTYRIYDIDPIVDSPNTIEYDNISYAIDTPKPGDFIIFNNFTEQVLNITKTNDIYKFTLVDESPNREILQNSSHVGLCIYDCIQKDILVDIYPFEVKKFYTFDSSIVDSSYYRFDVNNSYIEVKNTSDMLNASAFKDIYEKSIESSVNSSINSSAFFTNSINAYVYTANEYVFDSSDDIILDTSNILSYIHTSNKKQYFMKNQVIKICYADETVIHNDYTDKAIDNETAYRIINVNQNEDKTFTYTINGLIDLDKFNNKLYHNNACRTMSDGGKLITKNPYKLKMCPAHLRAAQYVLRINGYGEEFTSRYNKGVVQRTTVTYDPKSLLFDSYLDTTYSAQVFDYDPKLLQNIWIDASTQYKNEALYIYRDKPVTISKGRNIILRPDISQNILSESFNDTSVPLRIHWNWKSYIIDDHETFESEQGLIDKQVVFKSANKILSIKPELLGSQSPNMICCDVYGNRVINEADGFVYVDANGSNNTVGKFEEGTRDIMYKEVFIVGFDVQFSPLNTLSTYGETATYTISETGSSNENTNNISFKYKIYYSDGTIVENEGCNCNLLTQKGNVSKTNKVKFTVKEATESHKSKVGELQCKLTIDKKSDRDIIQHEQIHTLDIKQYGTSITTNIYDLSFNIKDIPSEGLDNIEEYIIRDYIKDIKYTLIRSEGEIEQIKSPTFENSMLKIKSFKIIHNQRGITNNIPENKSGRKDIGILQLTVQFNVHGIQNDIETTGMCSIYQL